MTEQFVYGKSYWEIVVHAFRKNWAARVALWISVTMLVIAVLAPVLANDRPFTFVGTLPGEYRKSYSGLTRGALMAISGAPARMKAEQDRFRDGTATLGMYKERLSLGETRAQYPLLFRLNARAQSRIETRGIWESNDVPFNDVVEEVKSEQRELPGELATLRKELADRSLSEETRAKKETLLAEREAVLKGIPRDLETLENTRQRIIRELPRVYGDRMAKDLAGLRLKLQEMAAQLDDAKEREAAAIEKEFTAVFTPDFLTSGRDRKAELKAISDKVKADFDPEKVTLVERRWWPLPSSLNSLDIFLIVFALGLGIAFGPLTWWKLKRIAPIERRWKVTWALAAAPAVLVAGVWFCAHTPRFESVTYKAGQRDGTVVMSSSWWPPIRWRYDELPPPRTDTSDENRPPTAPESAHPLGTDFLGRDLLSRMIWGGRISLSIGFVAMGIALFIGVTFGALAGFYRGKVDLALSRVIEIVICFPVMFLVLAVVAFLPPSMYYVMLVLGLFGWMGIARLLRGEFLRLVNLDYVQAARALGATNRRIMFRHLLPNALGPVLVAASFGIAGAMLTESALSFLGFGVQEPETSWGQILNTGRTHLEKWWTFIIPGAAIFVAVTCYNLVGDAIRDAVDPRLKT
jgi:peptide/nickel transport system permease protein